MLNSETSSIKIRPMAEDDRWVRVNVKKIGFLGTKTENTLLVPMPQKAEPNTRSQFISTTKKLLITAHQDSAEVEIMQIDLIKPQVKYLQQRLLNEGKPSAEIIEGKRIFINASLTTEKNVLDFIGSEGALVRYVDKFDLI